MMPQLEIEAGTRIYGNRGHISVLRTIQANSANTQYNTAKDGGTKDRDGAISIIFAYIYSPAEEKLSENAVLI